MILAVLAARAGVRALSHDVYASSVGGVRVVEPAADLASALAIFSATEQLPLVGRLAAFGEVGLSGEVRPVPAISRRLAEAARLGFRRAVVPLGSLAEGEPPTNITVIEVPDVHTALEICRDRLHVSG